MSGRCIAMWSGPRNISTAMMRAWENRADTVVVDEPLYAHFLEHTGLDHPMSEQIIRHGNTDWRSVVDGLSVPPESGFYYQKHISTHWLEHYSTDWLHQLSNIFLIREPEPVVASYSNKRDGLTASDLGYSQQAALFDLINSTGARPVVIDSQRFLANPASQLEKVCQALHIDFDSNMLSWPAGTRDTDGLWGAHWYDAVNSSTGFGPARSNVPELDARQRGIAEQCMPFYQAMKQYAI